jgi:hypothetical protein
MSHGQAVLTVEVLLVLGLAAALVAPVYRFVMFCLADLAASREVRYLPRETWRLLIMVVIPIGGLLYLACGKPR